MGIALNASSTVLATNIEVALTASGLPVTVAAQSGAVVTIGANLATGFSPVISVTAAQPTGLRLQDGGLQQRRTLINVYFGGNPLNVAAAQNPAFYRVINVATGDVLIPNDTLNPSVSYDPVTNTATLRFASLQNATYRVEIGGAVRRTNTILAGTNPATNVGTLYSDTGGFADHDASGNRFCGCE